MPARLSCAITPHARAHTVHLCRICAYAEGGTQQRRRNLAPIDGYWAGRRIVRHRILAPFSLFRGIELLTKSGLHTEVVMKTWYVVGPFVGAAIIVAFFAPAVPATYSSSWEAVCPQGTPPTQICGSDGSILFSGYGSLTYSLFGVGGWLGTPRGYLVVF